MDRGQTIHYLYEVIRQCQFANIADSLMRSAGGYPARDRNVIAFAGAQGILTAAAQMSKLFWPHPRGSRSSDRAIRAIERGDYLREIIQPNPILDNRDVRNSIEHFDEQLDILYAFTETEPDSSLVDTYFGSKESAKFASGKVSWLRHLDPETMVFSSLDYQVDLDFLLVAMRNASDAANRWMDGPTLTKMLQEETERGAQFED